MKEKLIEEAHRFYDEMGYVPSRNDYIVIPGTPSPNTITKYFGKWSKYIDECEFPDLKRGKDKVNTVYIGNGYNRHNYLQHFETLFIETKQIIDSYVEDVTYNILHNQLLFVFTYRNKHYAVAFLNRYVEDYRMKMEVIEEVISDMGIILINLNKSGRWYRKHLHNFFENPDAYVEQQQKLYKR